MMPKALGAASVRPFILSLLARQDTYGYQMMQYAESLSDGSLDLQAGILYPILRRLENDKHRDDRAEDHANSSLMREPPSTSCTGLPDGVCST